MEWKEKANRPLKRGVQQRPGELFKQKGPRLTCRRFARSVTVSMQVSVAFSKNITGIMSHVCAQYTHISQLAAIESEMQKQVRDEQIKNEKLRRHKKRWESNLEAETLMPARERERDAGLKSNLESFAQQKSSYAEYVKMEREKLQEQQDKLRNGLRRHVSHSAYSTPIIWLFNFSCKLKLVHLQAAGTEQKLLSGRARAQREP